MKKLFKDIEINGMQQIVRIILNFLEFSLFFISNNRFYRTLCYVLFLFFADWNLDD